MIVGALLAGMASSDNHAKHEASNHDYNRYPSNNYTISRRTSRGQYDGCHGVGCLVDNPDAPPEPTYGQPKFRGPGQ